MAPPKKTAPTFIVAGHVCLDIIPTFDERKSPGGGLLMPGKLINVGEAVFATGGTVSNTGLALHRLGMSTQLMGKVGDDPFGEAIIENLSAHDPALAEGMIIDPESQTSYSIVISQPGIDRIFLHNPGANDTFSPADIIGSDLSNARYFHFGYPPLMERMFADGGHEMATLLRSVKAQGLTVSLDMSYPDPDSASGQIDWRAWMQVVLPYVDIFLPSFDELLFMLDRPLFEQMQANEKFSLSADLLRRLADQLLAYGAAIAVLKLGDAGLYTKVTGVTDRLASMGQGAPENIKAWRNYEVYCPCFICEVVGTTGSGDCTIAGFLTAISKNLPPDDVLQMAVAIGGFNVESADATSSIPDWETALERVAAGWQQHPPTIQL